MCRSISNQRKGHSSEALIDQILYSPKSCCIPVKHKSVQLLKCNTEQSNCLRSAPYAICFVPCLTILRQRGFKNASQNTLSLYLRFLAQPTMTMGGRVWVWGINENKQYIVGTKRRRLLHWRGARGLIHNSEASQQYERGGRICLHYASVASALHHPPGWFVFESLIRSLSVALWLWLISASDRLRVFICHPAPWPCHAS